MREQIKIKEQGLGKEVEMNTISKCLFGGALLGAGLSSSAIGGTIVWGTGITFAFTPGVSRNHSGSGDWNLTSTNSGGAYAHSAGNEFGLSMITDGVSSSILGSASVSKNFTVSHDMLISFEWDFIGNGAGNMRITNSLSNTIFGGGVGLNHTRSAVPTELSFMAGETYRIFGFSRSFQDIFRFTMTGGNDINVVPLPPAAFGGLAMLAGLGAYRRVRR